MLKNISFTLKESEIPGITGLFGSGKEYIGQSIVNKKNVSKTLYYYTQPLQ